MSTELVKHVSEPELQQLLGIMRCLNLIDDGGIRIRSFTVLGPNAPLSSDTALTSLVSETADRVKVEPVGDEGDDTAEDGLNGACTEARPYPCCACGVINRPMGRKRWYAVTCGLDVGVFEGWDTVMPLVKSSSNPNIGLPGATNPVFRTKAEAEDHFRRAQAAGMVARLGL